MSSTTTQSAASIIQTKPIHLSTRQFSERKSIVIMFEASLNTVDDFLFYVAHLDEFGKKATHSISNSIELGEHRLPAMFKHFSFSCFFLTFFLSILCTSAILICNEPNWVSMLATSSLFYCVLVGKSTSSDNHTKRKWNDCYNTFALSSWISHKYWSTLQLYM